MALNSPLRLLLTLCEGFVGVSPLFLPVYRPCEGSDRQVSITIGHETQLHSPPLTLRFTAGTGREPSLEGVPVRVGDQEKPCLRVIRYLSLRGTKQSKLFAHQQHERFTWIFFICHCEARSNLNCLHINSVRGSQPPNPLRFAGNNCILQPPPFLTSHHFRLLHKRSSQ